MPDGLWYLSDVPIAIGIAHFFRVFLFQGAFTDCQLISFEKLRPEWRSGFATFFAQCCAFLAHSNEWFIDLNRLLATLQRSDTPLRRMYWQWLLLSSAAHATAVWHPKKVYWRRRLLCYGSVRKVWVLCSFMLNKF